MIYNSTVQLYADMCTCIFLSVVLFYMTFYKIEKDGDTTAVASRKA